MLPARVIHVVVATPWEQAYGFLSDPLNFVKWASGLGGGLEHLEGAEYMVTTPEGEARVRFSLPNAHGVLDHWVMLPGQEASYNPMRVVADGEGSLITFTLFQRSGMSEEQFEADAQWVAKDLNALKLLLEGGPE